MEKKRTTDVMIDINEKIKNFNYKQDQKMARFQRHSIARNWNPTIFDNTAQATKN